MKYKKKRSCVFGWGVVKEREQKEEVEVMKNTAKMAFMVVLSGILSGCMGMRGQISPPVNGVERLEEGGRVCGVTCIGEGVGYTAGHCIGKREEVIVKLRLNKCRGVGEVRIRGGVDGEEVEVIGYGEGEASIRESRVYDKNWLGWILLEGKPIHGESGGAIRAKSDGAILGIQVEGHDGLTYGRRLPRAEWK